MIRKAFAMQLFAGAEAEYRKRHSEIWPDLVEVLRSHGVRNYSIFVEPSDLKLFAYVELTDTAKWAEIAASSVCKRWWREMAELMEHHLDLSPVADDLVEVFHLD